MVMTVPALWLLPGAQTDAQVQQIEDTWISFNLPAAPCRAVIGYM